MEVSALLETYLFTNGCLRGAAGQPSVVYKHPYFYMVYTDTASRAVGGNRLFVTRSTDPTFQDREEWVDGKFMPYDVTMYHDD